MNNFISESKFSGNVNWVSMDFHVIDEFYFNCPGDKPDTSSAFNLFDGMGWRWVGFNLIF